MHVIQFVPSIQHITFKFWQQKQLMLLNKILL